MSFFILIIDRSIRAKTLDSNEASFVVQEMIPAYRAAVTSQGTSSKRVQTRRKNEVTTLTDKGPNKDKPRRDIVQNRIASGTLFPNIICAVSNGMTELSRKSFDEMANITGEVFKGIERDVYSAISQKEKEDQDGDRRQNGGSTSEKELLRKLGDLKYKQAMILRKIAAF